MKTYDKQERLAVQFIEASKVGNKQLCRVIIEQLQQVTGDFAGYRVFCEPVYRAAKTIQNDPSFQMFWQETLLACHDNFRNAPWVVDVEPEALHSAQLELDTQVLVWVCMQGQIEMARELVHNTASSLGNQEALNEFEQAFFESLPADVFRDHPKLKSQVKALFQFEKEQLPSQAGGGCTIC